MSAENQQFYSVPEAPYLRLLNQQTHDFLVYFFENKGHYRVKNLFESPFRHHELSTPRRARLTRLSNYLDCSPNPFNLGSISPDWVKQQWLMFCDDTNYALGESWLKFNDIIGSESRTFSSVKLYKYTRSLDQKHLDPILPDLVSLENGNGEAVLTDLYDYRRIVPSETSLSFHSRVGRVAATLQNPDTVTLLRGALLRAGLNTLTITIPKPEDIRFRVITAQKFRGSLPIKTIATEKGLSAQFDNDLAMDVQSNYIAFFVLKKLTGQLPAISSPREYFTPFQFHKP